MENLAFFHISLIHAWYRLFKQPYMDIWGHLWIGKSMNLSLQFGTPIGPKCNGSRQAVSEFQPWVSHSRKVTSSSNERPPLTRATSRAPNTIVHTIPWDPCSFPAGWGPQARNSPATASLSTNQHGSGCPTSFSRRIPFRDNIYAHTVCTGHLVTL